MCTTDETQALTTHTNKTRKHITKQNKSITHKKHSHNELQQNDVLIKTKQNTQPEHKLQ